MHFNWMKKKKLCDETSTCKYMQIIRNNMEERSFGIWFYWTWCTKQSEWERCVQVEKGIVACKNIVRQMCGLNVCTYNSLSSISICGELLNYHTIESEWGRNLNHLSLQWCINNVQCRKLCGRERIGVFKMIFWRDAGNHGIHNDNFRYFLFVCLECPLNFLYFDFALATTILSHHLQWDAATWYVMSYWVCTWVFSA